MDCSLSLFASSLEHGEPLTEDDLNHLKNTLIRLKFHCDKIGLKHSSRLIEISINDLPQSDRELNILTTSVKNEIESNLFLHIPSNRAQYYKPKVSVFGNEVIKKFPELEEDISESGNCFALDRYTACVVHLMRIMEKSIQFFGKKLKITLKKPIKDETWFQIAKAIKKAIDDLAEDTPKIKEKKDKYQALYAHLDSIRIAWRNKTMHPKETYTEEEAKTLLEAVGIFLKEISMEL